MVYAWNSSILYRAVHNPIAFAQHRSLARARSHLLKGYGTLGRHFLYLYIRMRTSGSPSNDPKLITQDRWIRNAVGRGIKEPVYAFLVNRTSPLKKTEVGPYQYYEYLNKWSIIHAFWMFGSMGTSGRSSDTHNWLCHPSREGLSRYLNGCLGQQSFSQYCQCS